MVKSFFLLLLLQSNLVLAKDGISCPIELPTNILNKSYDGWQRGTFNPLALSDAEIMFITTGDALEAILAPDETKPLNDINHSTYYYFHLNKHVNRRRATPFTLFCYYGDRVEYLQKVIPATMTKCQFNRWNNGSRPSIEVACD